MNCNLILACKFKLLNILPPNRMKRFSEGMISVFPMVEDMARYLCKPAQGTVAQEARALSSLVAALSRRLRRLPTPTSSTGQGRPRRRHPLGALPPSLPLPLRSLSRAVRQIRERKTDGKSGTSASSASCGTQTPVRPREQLYTRNHERKRFI